MWEELGISMGTGIIILIALYFIIKWSIKNGIEEAYEDITGKKTHRNQHIKISLKESDDEENESEE